MITIIKIYIFNVYYTTDKFGGKYKQSYDYITIIKAANISVTAQSFLQPPLCVVRTLNLRFTLLAIFRYTI